MRQRGKGKIINIASGTIMAGGGGTPAHYPAGGVIGLAVMAEAVGFQGYWKGESNSTDPLVLLSGVATRTSTIKLGTAIYHFFGRSPVQMGIQAATVQDMSGGRLLLGL